MKLYIESSAALAMLLGEPKSDQVREMLYAAELVTASILVLVECDRTLHRAVALGGMTELSAADRRESLYVSAAHWQIFELTPDIAERAKRAFPAEPLRSIDALHLATALAARAIAPEIELLSLDNRVRRNGQQLGFGLQPR